jgi:hypothetical protein
MAGVKLEMAATGVIAGRIVDLENRPARARVMAFEASYESGRRKLGVVETTVTDDRGEYRLFHLPPGRYFVGARALDPRQRTVNLVTYVSAAFGPVQESSTEAPLFMRAAENGETIEETYGLVFYGATEPERARPVDVGSGTTTATVDIDLSPARVRAYRIQGVAVDGNGSPVGGDTQVRAVPKVWLPSQIIPSANTDSNGNFEIAGLASGQYTLRALSANTNSNSPQTRVWGGHLPVEITGADLRDVRFVMTSGLTLQGRISFEGKDGLDASGLNISLQPDASLVAANTAVQANGTFNLSTVYPGEYRVSISPILTINTGPPYIPPRPIPAPFQDAYVKSIRLGVQDVLAGSVQIGSQNPGDFEIVIGTNGGLLEGVVVNKDRKGVPNATVALVPASTLRQRSDLYKSALTSAAGAFKLRAIAPGDYTLFAWEYAEPGIWHQSEFLRPFESSGKPIRISEGNNESIELTLLEQR